MSKFDGSVNQISYLGKIFRTSGRSKMTDEEFHGLIDYLYRRPDISDVDRELIKLSQGGTKTSNIVRYYLLDLIYRTQNREDAWSVEQATHCKEIWEYFKWKVEQSPKTFTDPSLFKRIESAIRLCGVRCCRKVSNFPINIMDGLLDKYLPDGGTYYDFSCGWAHRMLSSLKHNVTYLGTDPNQELIDRLQNIYDRYCELTKYDGLICIRPVGSEVFQSDWINKVDFCFSSPPYFNLELYDSKNQSCNLNTDYLDWLTDWWMATVHNAYNYLKPGSIFAFNVKNINATKTYVKLPARNLEDDMCQIILQDNLFRPEEVLPLNNIRRPFEYKTDTRTAEEKIFVFRKI